MSNILQKIYFKIFRVLHFSTENKFRGNVLLSYIPYAFLRPKNIAESHTNYWECREIANIFLRLGYNVDVINWQDSYFIPKKKYTYCVDIHQNLERLTPMLGAECIKIFHATGSHSLFQNHAELERLLALQSRRGVTLHPMRQVPPSLAIEHADYTLLLGNNQTANTYKYAQKKIFQIPLSTTHTYPYNDKKNIDETKKKFLWFGGAGMVHKGLDLVLEAFAEMPEYSLSVCGNVKAEKDFEKAYHKELYETKNIKLFGKIDPSSDTFKKIISSTSALIYPTCSEGQSGAVITALHAGLIPIITPESGVDINDFGFSITDISVEGIKKQVRDFALLPNNKIATRSKKAWEYAKERHTREKFSEEWKKIINQIEKDKK